MVAGLQVPVTPFVDAFGNDGTDPPEQTLKEVPNVNDGVSIGLTVTVNVTIAAH